MTAPTWENRIIGYGVEAPDQLLANPDNVRRHDRHQQSVMEAMLREVGYVQDVIVNQRTGTLIDGHMRVSLALRDGQATVPVKYVDLDPEAEKIAVATLDAITELADHNAETFEELLASVSTSEEALQNLLDTMYRAGGGLPDDTTDGDDWESSTPLPSLKWGRYAVIMSRDERDSLIEAIDDYQDRHGNLAGFVTWLLEPKEMRDASGS